MINLLKFNEKFIKEKFKMFLKTIIILIFISIVLDIFLFTITKKISTENSKNRQILTDINYEIKKLRNDKSSNYQKIEEEIKKESKNKLDFIKVLNNICSIIPNKIYLREVCQENSFVLLVGESNSYEEINEFIKKIKKLKIFNQITFVETTTDELTNKNRFIFQCFYC